MKLALCMIVKGSNDEAELLDRCLENVSPFVDGIFITRTHLPGEKLNKAVGQVAGKYKAQLSDFEWVYDFATARTYNFSQVPKEYDYVMWTDADDMWRGLEKLRAIMAKSPSMDAFGFKYIYDWDDFKKPTVIHRKTMIVRNDGCVEWMGAIHEDLIGTRTIEVQYIDSIERLHLTTKKRSSESAIRNLEISKKAIEALPDDPRSLFNLANAEFGVGNYKRSAKVFEQFILDTESDDERYVAHLRMGDVAKAGNDMQIAIRHLQMAIGLQPQTPDAYLQLAHLYYNLSNWDKAEEYVLNGMKRRPQVDKMIVYNPRDYDYNPMMLLARVYYEKNRPDLMLPLLQGCLRIYPKDKHLQRLVKEGKKEKAMLGDALIKVQKLEKINDLKKLKKELDALPSDLQSHPAIAVLRNQHFIKKESSGRDLVIYCGNTAHAWNPELFEKKGFGGSEEAIIHLAREWAKLGWNVTVYNNCGHKAVREPVLRSDVPDVGYVLYRPFWEFNYRDKQDVVIVWRWPKVLDAPINAPKVFVDMHDVISSGEFTEKRLQKITKVFVKSQFHREIYANIPDDKIVVLPNGFQVYSTKQRGKDQYLIINTSSPDRSMDVLPRLFKEIKKRVPQARLQWAYGWDNFKTGYANDTKKLEWMQQTQEAMQEAGIEDLGRLTQAEVGQLYQRAHIFAYPTEFAEIDCISVKKAQASQCKAITTDFGALDESNVFGIKIHSPKTKDTWNKPYQFHFGLEGEMQQQLWIDAVVQELESGNFVPPKDEVERWAEGFEWRTIAERWNKILKA